MYEIVPIIQLSIYLVGTIILCILLFINYWDQSRIMSMYGKTILMLGIIWQPISIARIAVGYESPFWIHLMYGESQFYHLQMGLTIVIQQQLLKVFSGMEPRLSDYRLRIAQFFTFGMMVVMVLRNTYEYLVLRYEKPENDITATIAQMLIYLYTLLGLIYETLHFVYLFRMLVKLARMKKNVEARIKEIQEKRIKQLMYLAICNMGSSWFSFILYIISAYLPPDIAGTVANFAINILPFHGILVIYANVLMKRIQVPTHVRSRASRKTANKTTKASKVISE